MPALKLPSNVVPLPARATNPRGVIPAPARAAAPCPAERPTPRAELRIPLEGVRKTKANIDLLRAACDSALRDLKRASEDDCAAVLAGVRARFKAVNASFNIHRRGR